MVQVFGLIVQVFGLGLSQLSRGCTAGPRLVSLPNNDLLDCQTMIGWPVEPLVIELSALPLSRGCAAGPLVIELSAHFLTAMTPKFFAMCANLNDEKFNLASSSFFTFHSSFYIITPHPSVVKFNSYRSWADRGHKTGFSHRVVPGVNNLRYWTPSAS
ncbi:hypothetical protein B879_03619 [Cecembia lonarensis LW9]|uniref:Uncharacterized protein n=1 Tax=Cecembia lonarensis (strain CCUG 58316 / KCTC 22772 / LW9) TaxID=1225176 RepID=K1LBT3_CECL9|nr:hypothetical protein B879_03619 [Cecembia lonarensis LW9]